MYRAFVCLSEEHTAWTFPLAALVCWVASVVALRLLEQARIASGRSKLGWLLAAGFSAGAGTWSTHFVGMLGYDPGFGVGYSPWMTLLSLAIAIGTALASFQLFLSARGLGIISLAGLLLGTGIAVMHFSGMAGVRAPGYFRWEPTLVVAAIVIGCTASVATLLVQTLARPRDSLRLHVTAASILTAGIAGLHFIAMAAAEFVPDGRIGGVDEGLPRGALATGIATAIAVMAILSCVALFAERMRRVNGFLAEREAALREKTALLDATLENMDQGLLMVDGDGVVRVCNERAMTLLDLPPEMMRAQPRFDDVRAFQLAQNDFVSSSDMLRHWVATSGMMSDAHTYERERPNGVVLEIRTLPRPSGGAVRTYTDVTARKRAEQALSTSQERLALALDAGSDGLWDWCVPTGQVWFSERWWTMLGYERGEIEHRVRVWFRLVHPDDEEPARLLLNAHCDGRTPVFEAEYRLRTKAGAWAWVQARGKVVERDGDGMPLRIVGTHVDITARKAAEGRIAHLARHDALTDLPNRTLFRERLDERMAEIARYGGSCAVLWLDLDRFKAVNDTLGHLAGDALLGEIARRLRGAVRAADTVARLGGDEFAVLVEDGADRAAVVALARTLIDVTRAPFALGEQWAEVGLSVGIACAPEHGSDGDNLFKRADLALYSAKADGRSRHRMFEPAMDDAAAAKLGLERDLRAALSRDEFLLLYQPQVRSESGELVGFEALVRWQHPSRGLVTPDTFIPLAEETGLIVELGEWVLRTACREASRWTRPLKVAVNLSPRQFQQADLPDRILAVLAETGLPPARLELEVTENVIIHDLARALGVLRRLKSFGIRIAMDDFGTGYSSLSTLQAFPFDKIKIDRSFVGQVERSPQAGVIVKAVLGLGRSLGMQVVAEGVETAEQKRFLIDHRCDELQGYLFGRPQAISSFADAVQREDQLDDLPVGDPLRMAS